MPANRKNTRSHNRKRAAVPQHNRPSTGTNLKLYRGSEYVPMERRRRGALFYCRQAIPCSPCPARRRKLGSGSSPHLFCALRARDFMHRMTSMQEDRWLRPRAPGERSQLFPCGKSCKSTNKGLRPLIYPLFYFLRSDPSDSASIGYGLPAGSRSVTSSKFYLAYRVTKTEDPPRGWG